MLINQATTANTGGKPPATLPLEICQLLYLLESVQHNYNTYTNTRTSIIFKMTAKKALEKKKRKGRVCRWNFWIVFYQKTFKTIFSWHILRTI